MNKTLSLRKNFVWAFIGNTFAAFCSWLLLIILIKIGTVEVVGIFAVAQAICLPVSLLCGLQLTIVQITDVNNVYLFEHYYTVKFLMALITVIISTAIGLVFYSFDFAIVVFVLSISYAVVDVRKAFLAVMQKNERMDNYAISFILQGILGTLLFTLLFVVSKSLIVAVPGLIAARLLVSCFYDRNVIGKLIKSSQGIIPRLKLVWQRPILWKLIVVAFPLGIVGFFQTLLTTVPKLVLDKYSGKAEVGYFTAISSLLVAGTMIISALSQTVNPRLAKYFHYDRKAFKVLMIKLMCIALVLGSAGIIISSLFGKYILYIVFKPDYAEHNDLFIISTIAGGVLFVFTFMNCGLNAAKCFKIQVPIYAGAALSGAVFSFWLIPNHGMIGAMISIIASYLVGFTMSLFFLLKALKKPYGTN